MQLEEEESSEISEESEGSDEAKMDIEDVVKVVNRENCGEKEREITHDEIKQIEKSFNFAF